LDELSKTPDFDVTITGFDIPEINELFDQLQEAKEDDFEAKIGKDEDAITKTGDLKKEDILMYLPDSFKGQLSKNKREYIQDAFYKAVLTYQKRNEENYLNRILI